MWCGHFIYEASVHDGTCSGYTSPPACMYGKAGVHAWGLMGNLDWMLLDRLQLLALENDSNRAIVLVGLLQLDAPSVGLDEDSSMLSIGHKVGF